MACNNESRYLDLSTGNRVDLKKDSTTGLMVDAETGKPVRLYVDRESKDTIWGPTGKVVNGKIVKSDKGEWTYSAENEMNNDGSDYKRKVEKDGDIKIKDGDKKIKIDGETGEKKVKNDD